MSTCTYTEETYVMEKSTYFGFVRKVSWVKLLS